MSDLDTMDLAPKEYVEKGIIRSPSKKLLIWVISFASMMGTALFGPEGIRAQALDWAAIVSIGSVSGFAVMDAIVRRGRS